MLDFWWIITATPTRREITHPRTFTSINYGSINDEENATLVTHSRQSSGITAATCSHQAVTAPPAQPPAIKPKEQKTAPPEQSPAIKPKEPKTSAPAQLSPTREAGIKSSSPKIFELKAVAASTAPAQSEIKLQIHPPLISVPTPPAPQRAVLQVFPIKSKAKQYIFFQPSPLLTEPSLKPSCPLYDSSHFNKDILIQTVGKCLDNQQKLNADRRITQYNPKKPIEEQKLNQKQSIPFNSLAIPRASFLNYFARFRQYSGASDVAYVLALIYMDRIVVRNEFMFINPYNIHRFFAAAIMTTAKFFDDVYQNNAWYAQIAGITTVEINALEAAFLKMIHYDLYVSTDTFNLYLKALYDFHNPQVVSQPKRSTP